MGGDNPRKPEGIPGFFMDYRVAILGLGLMGGSLAMALHGKCAGITRWVFTIRHLSSYPAKAALYLEEEVRLRLDLINKFLEVPL